MICFFFIDRPLRFGLCVAAVLSSAYFCSWYTDDAEQFRRSYFGIMKVEQYKEPYRSFYFTFEDLQDPTDADGKRPSYLYMFRQPYRKLLHGTTLHGVQADGTWTIPILDDSSLFAATSPWHTLAIHGMQQHYDLKQEPLTYYHRNGPVGSIFQRFRKLDPMGHIGMVGLGTGSISCYAYPGQKLTFYEIDKHIVELVEEGKYFSYVNDAKKRGAEVNIVLGDARLQLAQTQDRYGILLIDAFSSDSIPVHLLTVESLQLYKSCLTERGLLALHISIRYIDLEPVVAHIAKATGMECRIFSDNEENYSGKTRSSWVILAKNPEDLGDEILGIAADTRYGAVAGGLGYDLFDNSGRGFHVLSWKPLHLDKKVEPWTDDFSDVLRVMRMEEIRAIRRYFGLPVARDDQE